MESWVGALKFGEKATYAPNDKPIDLVRKTNFQVSLAMYDLLEGRTQEGQCRSRLSVLREQSAARLEAGSRELEAVDAYLGKLLQSGSG